MLHSDKIRKARFVTDLDKDQGRQAATDKRLDLVEQLNFALLDQTFQFIAVLDSSGRIEEANNTFLEIGMYKMDGIKGAAIADLPIWEGLDDARIALCSAIQSAAAGNFARIEIPLRDISGDLLTMDVSIKAIRSPDFGINHLIFEARDITDLKASQHALLQSQKYEMAGHLTSGIAHDFNNILAVIAGHLELAAKLVSADNKAGERIESALTAVFRGKELTEQLLSLSRKREMNIEAIDVNAAISESADLLDRTLLRDCELDIQPNTDLWLGHSDTTQLQTSIMNLVINACDAMPCGGTATIKARNISLASRADAKRLDLAPGDYIAIAIQDEGIGMSSEQVNQAIEPFFTTKAPGSGTGLGLSIVNNFARECGGALAISSALKIGTTITLYIPRSFDALPGADEPGKTRQRLRPRTTRILVVEDNGDLRETVVRALEEAGHDVEQAADAEAALSLLKEEAPFGILFTDISLGGNMSGRELAKEAQALDVSIKIILTTGLPNDIEPQSKLESDGTLLVKPFHQDELIRRIQQMLAEQV